MTDARAGITVVSPELEAKLGLPVVELLGGGFHCGRPDPIHGGAPSDLHHLRRYRRRIR
jgi:hypothetical protein